MPAEASATAAQVAAAAELILDRCRLRPQVGIILGSGLASLADEVLSPTVIRYADIPHHPRPTVPGHPGELVLGTLEGVAVALWRGRVHAYEGRDLAEVAFPIRLMRRLGAEAAMLTNAAGGLNPEYAAGDLMLIADHISLPSLAGHSPLRGEHEPSLGERFVPLTSAYDPHLAALALQAAADLGQPIHRGLYAMVGGPSYETPAEARLLRMFGADAVGMSTVPEVIVACQAGLRVLAISAITNVVAMAADAPGPSHAEVLAVADRIKTRFAALLRGILIRMRDSASP
jgi:purine-nucleoside phosphorylase